MSSIVCGGGHSIAICSNGDVYTWGINTYGQCGYTAQSPVPKKAEVPGKVKGGSAGLAHSFLLLENKSVCVTGWNSNGQLGVQNNFNLFKFTLITLSNINYISCGAVHTLVVLGDGNVYSTGGNSCGQLGLGHFNDTNTFSRVTGLSNISICRSGEEYSIAVSSKSIIYSFGLGNVGQLGYDEQVNNTPKAIPSMGSNLGTEYIACTKSTVLAVTRNFETYSWGIIPNYAEASSKASGPALLSILKSKRVKEIQCLRDTFLICTEYVTSSSYISKIPKDSIEAGKKYNINVNLIDSSSMFVLEPLDKIGVVSFNSSGEMSKGEVIQFFDNYTHIIQLNLIESGYHSVYVFCNGVQLQNSPFVYTVRHSEFKTAKGYVPSDNLVVNAGVGFLVLVKIYDRYGNLVLCDPGLKFSINIGGKCEVIDFEEGCYRVIVYCTELGKHVITLKSNGIVVPMTLEDYSDPEKITEVCTKDTIDAQVLPGIIDPCFCQVVGFKSEYVAGEAISFSIVCKDSYSNTTWHRSKPWEIDMSIAYSLEDSIDYCTTHAKCMSTKSCKVPIKISYESKVIFESCINIHPGPVCIPNTVIKGEGACNSFFTHPVTREFTLEFYDQYFNSCPADLAVESNLEYSIQKRDFFAYNISYSLQQPGKYHFFIYANSEKLEINIDIAKDPSLALKEKLDQDLIQQNKLKLLKEQQQIIETQNKKNFEDELKRKSELKLKEKAMQADAAKQKQLEDAEILRRQKIIERIKMQEITKKRGLDALKKLEEEKKKKEVKKWKRIGGGFVVPFDLEDI